MNSPGSSSVVDCDVHAVPAKLEVLMPYLPAYWREQIAQTGFGVWSPAGARAPSALADPRVRGDSIPASQASYLQRDLLTANSGLSHVILNCDSAIETLHNPDAAAAIATALNEWLAAEWLARDPRLRASIVVPPQFPDLAAAEIDRMANRPGFVQVLLPVRSESPYGSHNFAAVFAAAARHSLPVGLHSGGAPGNASTPVGWPSYFLEEYAGMSSVFQTQLISIVAGGVFDSHPELKLVLIESGVAWLAPMLWRLDKNWKGLRREIPWVRRAPSEYIWEHVRLTTAPFDAPGDDPARLAEIVAQLGSEDVLLYASDYPHFHGEPPVVASLDFLNPALANKIKSQNPRNLYRL